jgi:methyl-accepting chemotaxis protein
MTNRFSTTNWPFWVKFAVPGLLALALLAMIQITAINSVNNLKHSLQDVVERKFTASVELAGSVEQLRAVNGALYQLMTQQAAGTKPDVAKETKNLIDSIDRINAQLTQFKGKYASPEDSRKIDGAITNLNNYKDAISFVASMVELDFKMSVNFMAPIGQAYNAALTDLSTISGGFLAISKKDAQSEVAQVEVRQNVLLTVAAVLALVVAGLTISIVIMTIRSVRGLADATHSLAQGDIKIDLTRLERSDELGQIVSALAIFRDNSIRVNGLKAEQEAAAAAADQTKRQALLALANDLESDIGKVVTNVVTATDGMRTLAEGMRGETRKAAALSKDVSRSSNELSTNVGSVAAATEELSASVAEVARQVTDTARIAQDAVSQTDAANNTIAQLSQAALRIGDAAQLISDIAAQTNLLALNATIEAARAGDAGKGFAVVASEVKNLANQTARATEEISAQIRQIQDATTDTVKAVQGVGQTIRQISEIAASVAGAAEEQGSATKEISRNVQTAAAGTHDVSAALEDVANVALNTGQSAEQVMTSVELLVGETQTLNHSITRFLTTVRRG